MKLEASMKKIAARCWKAPALVVAIFILLVPALAAQATPDAPKPDAAKKDRWTAEDVVYQEDGGQFRISPDGKFTLWVKGTADLGVGIEPLVALESPPIAASGAWTGDDTYTAIVCHYHTPHITTERLQFTGDKVIFEARNNVGFNGNMPVRLVGTAQP